MSDAKEFLQSKTIAVVGSGPGVLDNEEEFIDSHDVVVRINNFRIFPATGYRTDVLYSFFGHSIRKSVFELIRAGVFLCMCKCPNDEFMKSRWHEKRNRRNGVDFRYIYDFRKDWWFCHTCVPTVDEFRKKFELLDGHIPTTGFAAILDVLSCEPSAVYLTGFDFFRSGLHNVNERWLKRNDDDPIGHVPEMELSWLKDNVDKYPITVDRKLGAMLAER